MNSANTAPNFVNNCTDTPFKIHWYVPVTGYFFMATTAESHGYCSIESRTPSQNDKYVEIIAICDLKVNRK